jgi:hypothetical protein
LGYSIRQTTFENAFRQIAIHDAELRIDERIALFIGVNDGGPKMAGAWKNRTQILIGEGTALRFSPVKDDKPVTSSGNASLDPEEIAELRPFGITVRTPIMLGMVRINRPLAGST